MPEFACEDCGGVTNVVDLVIVSINRWPWELCPRCASNHDQSAAAPIPVAA